LENQEQRQHQLEKKTLLVEYNQQGKNNTFIDNRFGEKNVELTEDQKMLFRFQKERQRKFVKTSKFNLEETDTELTHKGVSLSDIDNLKDDYVYEDDDKDSMEDEIQRETVETLHFGGGKNNSQDGEDGDNKQKTKKDIMSEIIAKSKVYKMERQKEKEDQAELKDKLDEDYTSIISQLAFNKKGDTKNEKIKY